MKAKVIRIFKNSFWVMAVLLIIGAWLAVSYFGINYFAKEKDLAGEEDGCNVTGINLHGDIVNYHAPDAYNDQGNLQLDQTSADEVLYYVRGAEENDDIKAIIVEIDSSGGYPEAGEEIMMAFKRSKKPVVAFIRSQGLSSAYMAATGAQTIFASKFSDVGSIGITMSYLQDVEKNKKDGLTFIDLSSGKFKDSGNPSRALTEEEKNIFMRDIKIGYQYFVDIVSQNRKLDVNKVKALADGSSMMGEAALKNGLIDKIGAFPDVKKFVSAKIGEPVSVCWEN